jgi:hypothetical protein
MTLQNSLDEGKRGEECLYALENILAPPHSYPHQGAWGNQFAILFKSASENKKAAL